MDWCVECVGELVEVVVYVYGDVVGEYFVV